MFVCQKCEVDKFKLSLCVKREYLNSAKIGGVVRCENKIGKSNKHRNKRNMLKKCYFDRWVVSGTVEPWYDELQGTGKMCSLELGIRYIWVLFHTFLLILGWRISFVITGSSLKTGPLYRGSIVKGNSLRNAMLLTSCYRGIYRLVRLIIGVHRLVRVIIGNYQILCSFCKQYPWTIAPSGAKIIQTNKGKYNLKLQ